MLPILGISLLVFVSMLLEARLARRHEAALRARGGVEATGDVYPIMQVAYPGCFLGMVIEGTLTDPPTPGALATGLAIFTAAKLLKYWAIAALGRRWTFRVIVVPGEPLVARGPYRYLRHPNYLAVWGELVGVAVALGAPVSGILSVAGFGALMLRRIAVEERMLGLR